MKAFLKKDSGAIAIESVLGMFIFMVVILSIMFISLLVRIQSTMQYAISQTAKEISTYYYVVDKLGLAVGFSSDPDSVSKINTVIDNTIDFAAEADDVMSINIEDGIQISDLQNLTESDLPGKAQALYNSSVDLSSDLQGQLKGSLMMIVKSMLSEGMSNYVAPFICKTVVPKYVSGDYASTDEMLKNMGIEEGVNGLDFSKSTFLKDGRTIQIVVVYKLNTKNMTFGYLDMDLYFKQVATTAAWVRPNGASLKKVAETAK